PELLDRLHHRVGGLIFEANVADQRQRLAARGFDLLGGGEDGAGQPGVRLRGLGGDRDVGAVARGPQRDGEADAAARPGDEQRLALQRAGHHAPAFLARSWYARPDGCPDSTGSFSSAQPGSTTRPAWS